jgi:hypothetical protein
LLAAKTKDVRVPDPVAIVVSEELATETGLPPFIEAVAPADGIHILIDDEYEIPVLGVKVKVPPDVDA